MNGWISVNDRLPEYDEAGKQSKPVLVVTRQGTFIVSHRQ